MKFNVYSNLYNGAGLQKDWELIGGILRKHGHEVIPVDINRFHPNRVDVNIFLEIVNPRMLHKDVARKNWLIPNSEWWPSEDTSKPDNWNNFLHRFDLILCKTKDCYDIWSRKVGKQKCRFIGWEAIDRLQVGCPKFPVFLHLAGKSETKNTAAVVEAWRKFNLPYRLIVSAFKPQIKNLCGVWNAQKQRIDTYANIRQVDRFPESEVNVEMNRAMFHIMPSKYEGFGHAIHEALSCGGIVITTNAAPMSQFKGVPSELLIPISKREPRGPAFFNIVSPESVAAKVKQAANLSLNRVTELSGQARKGFEEERQFFRDTIDGVIREANL